ncbi:MAG TPA: hypothetical protein DEH78_29565, partial [Solibacterales bacterium]|nr:hypothetical protein [Bryobacterales bacterium]
VRTYIQSGNVVFRTRRTAHLASRLEDAIEAAAGFRPAVMVRTAAELRAVAAANPFPAGFDPAKLAVHFLSAPPGAQLPEIATPGGETMHLAGRELFVYYPEGMGRSKLPVARLERALGVISTARNWNTLLQLIDLAEAW